MTAIQHSGQQASATPCSDAVMLRAQKIVSDSLFEEQDVAHPCSTIGEAWLLTFAVERDTAMLLSILADAELWPNRIAEVR